MIRMLAQKNEHINDASNTIYQLTQDEKIRMQCEAREDYYRTQRGWQDMLEEKNGIIQEQEGTIAEQKAALEAISSELNKLLAWAEEHGYQKE